MKTRYNYRVQKIISFQTVVRQISAGDVYDCLKAVVSVPWLDKIELFIVLEYVPNNVKKDVHNLSHLFVLKRFTLWFIVHSEEILLQKSELAIELVRNIKFAPLLHHRFLSGFLPLAGGRVHEMRTVLC